MFEKIKKSLLDWCSANFILVNHIEEQVFDIPNFGKCYLMLPVEGKLIDEEMFFLTDGSGFELEDIMQRVEEKQIDYLIFQFGGQFYYCKPILKKDSYNEQRFVVDFTDLKYVGTNTLAYDIPLNPLGIHTEYDILNGNGLKVYGKKAKHFGYTCVGMCDKNTLAGSLAWQTEIQKLGLKPVIGETIDVATDYDSNNPTKTPTTYELKLYIATWQGWQNLLQINKCINVDYPKFIPEQELVKYQKGLVCVVGTESYLNFNDKPKVLKWLGKFKDFEGRYFQVDCSEFFAPGDDHRRLDIINAYFKSQWLELLPPILIQDIYYCDKEMYIVKDYLNKVAKRAYDYSEDQYMKSFDTVHAQMAPLFQDEERYWELMTIMLDNVNKVCEQCGSFEIETGERRLPLYSDFVPCDMQELFTQLVLQGFQNKVIDKDLDGKVYLERLETELQVIKEGELESYFLILWDITNWCHENEIMVGPARGSAAGSLVMHCLGITNFDPIPFQLLFERFLNRTRVLPQIKYEVKYADGTNELVDEARYKEGTKKKVLEAKLVKKYQVDQADVDLDFQANMREYVKEYIKARFGQAYSCNIGTFVNFQPRGCVKNFGKIKGLQFSYLNFVSRDIPVKPTAYTFRDMVEYAVKGKELKEFFQKNPEIIFVSKHVLDQPITQSIHASGMLVFPKQDQHGHQMDIHNWLPVRQMEGKIVSEWEGSYCDIAGFLKEDILALTELSKFKSILSLIKQNHKKEIDLDNLPLDDAPTYKLFQKGYNEDVFQFNSSGLKVYSQKVKPDCFEDLIAINALYRPGPMESNAHIDFALMKHGKKQAHFDYGLESVTKHTQGLYIYQEQAMLALVVLGGFTLVESDDFRKKIKKFLRTEMLPLHDKFIAGAIARKCPPKEAEEIWGRLLAFGNYGFNKCCVKNSVIKTIEGNKTIEELYKEFTMGKNNILFSLNEKGEVVQQQLKRVFDNGIRKDIFEIELCNGSIIQCTSNHVLLTNNGYKKICDLDIDRDSIIGIHPSFKRQFNNDYYIYALINPINKQVFYIGYGRKNRMYHHYDEYKRCRIKASNKKHNKLKLEVINEIELSGKFIIYKKLAIGLNWLVAKEQEIKFIAEYGNVYDGTGVLTNLTKGGDGGYSPFIEYRNAGNDESIHQKILDFHANISLEERERWNKSLSRAALRRTKHGMTGKQQSEYSIRRAKESQIGNKHATGVRTKEHKNNIREGRKYYDEERRRLGVFLAAENKIYKFLGSTEAAKFLGVSEVNINEAARIKRLVQGFICIKGLRADCKKELVVLFNQGFRICKSLDEFSELRDKLRKTLKRGKKICYNN